MTPFRPILALFLLAALAGPAMARQETPPARIEVTGTIQLGDGIHDAKFAPDGRSIYLVVEEKVVWVGVLLIAHRRAILGVVFIAVALPIAWTTLRIIRRPRRAGAFHCRGCNYDVSAQLDPASLGDRHPRPRPLARCPECGIELARARPVLGRRTRARLAVPLTILGIIAGAAAYGSTSHCAHVLAATRFGSWASPRLAAWNERHRFDLLLFFSGPSSRVDRIDLDSGRDERTILQTRPYARINVSPHSDNLLLTWPGSNVVQTRNASAGRRVRTATLPGRTEYSTSGSPTRNWSNDGLTAYIAWWNNPGEPGGLTAFNIKSGVASTIWSNTRDVQIIGTHDCMRIGREEPPTFMIWTNDRPQGTATEVRVLTPGVDERTFTLPGPMEPSTRPAVTADSRTAYFAMEDMGMILAIDTITGTVTRQISIPGGVWQGLLLINQDQRLVVCTTDSIFLLDLSTGTWTHQLALPEDRFRSINAVVACDTWVAAIYERLTLRAYTGPPLHCDLLLWKLPPPPPTPN